MKHIGSERERLHQERQELYNEAANGFLLLAATPGIICLGFLIYVLIFK